MQKKWMPEINAYYKMSSAGLFVFPWLDRENEDMQGYLKREGSSWISLDGYAMCERNALYLPSRTMRLGNIYELAVTYGDSMTKILRFLYTDQRTLEILSYRPGTLEMGEPEKKSVISSLKGGGRSGTVPGVCHTKRGKPGAGSGNTETISGSGKHLREI